jgi:hypothetical protein
MGPLRKNSMVWGRFQGCIGERMPGVRAQEGKYAGLGGAESVRLQAAVMERGSIGACAIRRRVQGEHEPATNCFEQFPHGRIQVWWGMCERAQRSRVHSKNKADQGVFARRATRNGR